MRISDIFAFLGSISVDTFCFNGPRRHGSASLAVDSRATATNTTAPKDAFISSLVSNMTVPELVLQMHLMFTGNIIGPNSTNELYPFAMRFAPDAAVGIVHDWYPMNTSHYNGLQKLALEKARLKIPFLQFGECLHGVGSYKQSMFPQAIGLAASWDAEMVYRVGRAIGTEARSIGIHACLSPVLDLCKDPRWGRCQENWGEDKILTAHLGTAYASGLSKNGSWSDPDAVVPVMKHFAAHGSAQAGVNGGPWMGHGNREILEDLLVPFKAAFDLGGVNGVMMSYNELDDVPAHVSPLLYQALDDWGFDGIITADDAGMNQLQVRHKVAAGPEDAIHQWYNAGGMIQYYDYPLEVLLNATIDHVKSGKVSEDTLRAKVHRVLGVKYDLGLFENPFIAESVDPYAIMNKNVDTTLDAARKSIVLLKNANSTLPLSKADLKKIAIVGPMTDILNYGDYSGSFGMYPVANSYTVLQGVLDALNTSGSKTEVASSWGANTWISNVQYPIPGYHLSANGTTGGLLATYYDDPNFATPTVQRIEVPTLDWGLYPPPGLSSVNFSATWDGTLTVPTSTDVNGWLGIALSANTTAKVYIDDELHVDIPISTSSNILSNIPPFTYNQVNSTLPPPGSAPFRFRPGATHKLRIEYRTWNLYQKVENVVSVNAQVLLFWNLVDNTKPTSPVEQAVSVAKDADLIILAVGAAWNSDGEGGDRATLGLSPNQTALADAIYSLGKPVVLLLQGGRPFGIPEYYNQSAAALNAFFPGQSGGKAIADVLFGDFNPGGRMPVSIPKYPGQLPIFYNYKATARLRTYLDADPHPSYPFGYGLSYTTFLLSNFAASSGNQKNSSTSFTEGQTIEFTVDITNNGTVAGSYVPQVYLLQRVSQLSQPVKQLVAFQRVYLNAGETRTASMILDVDRYLKILNRGYEWELEAGNYTFALLEHGGSDADTSNNVTMICY